MSPPIGIMQGRLSPPTRERIQSFPVDTWSAEFERARAAGLACIEWVYEQETEDANPLARDDGIEEIASVADNAGVEVSSVCADYYMRVRLIDGARIDADAVAHLGRLLARAARLGVRYVVLPFIDESRLRTAEERDTLKRVVSAVLPAAEHAGIELHLETDLGAEEAVELLTRIDHPLVRANYDTGNAAALGHLPDDELPLLGAFLGSVHVKDRLLGGPTVALGGGAADLVRCFTLIQAAGFAGPYILQAARNDRVDEVEHACRNRLLVERLLAESV